MSGAVVEIVRTTGEETETVGRAVYEHPLAVRLCHWVNAISLFVMVGSGLQIFRAFPSFGAKIPELLTEENKDGSPRLPIALPCNTPPLMRRLSISLKIRRFAGSGRKADSPTL